MPVFPRFLYARALAVLAPFVLAACGGQASAPPSASVSPAAAVSAKPAPGSQAPAQARPVKLAWATQTSEFLPPQVGLEAGIFQKHGIDLQLVYTGSGPTAIASLVSGDVQFIELADPSVTRSALEGSGVEWVATATHKPNLAFWVHASTNSVQELKGKKVGVTSLGSLTALFAEYVLQKNGLDPKKDVQEIAVGGGLEQQAAMLNNQIDAMVTAPETPLPGQKILIDLREGFAFPQGGLAATKTFVQKDPKLVQDTIDAYAESVRRFKSDSALAEQVDAKELKRSDAAAVKAEVKGAAEAMSDDVAPKAEDLQTVLDMLAPTEPKAKTAKPQDLFDDRFGKAVPKV